MVFFILLGCIVLPTEVDVDLLMLCKLSLQVCLVLDCLFLLYGSLKLQQIPSLCCPGPALDGHSRVLSDVQSSDSQPVDHTSNIPHIRNLHYNA